MERLQEDFLTEREKNSGLYDNDNKKLDPNHPEVIELSQGLVEMLHLKVGGQAAMLVSTLNGQANALDITVGHSFNTGNAGSNDKFAFVPLSLARSLLDADGRADRLTILLDDVNQTEAMRMHLLEKFNKARFNVEIQTWQELSDFYIQVHDMFDMIFGFIFSIVLTVVIMSVANSMGMTVIERTREIGTLRAMGLKRGSVVKLFTIESMLLTVLGGVTGLCIMLAVMFGINSAGISYVPPNSAREVGLQVDWDASRVIFTFVLMAVVGTLAAYMPARRAAKKPIIDALGHI